MRIGGYSNFYIDNAHFRVARFGRVIQAPPDAVEQTNAAEAPDTKDQLTYALTRVLALREALNEFDPRLLRLRTRRGAADGPASATSTSNLGLDNTTTPTVLAAAGPATFIQSSAASTPALGLSTTSTPTVLHSTEEVNATPTSISTFAPVWIGSTAQTTMGGTYDGSNGSGTLTFRVDSAGTHGTDNLKIKVYDPSDTFLEDIVISNNDPLNTPYTLSNGLTLTLGAGDLLDNDSFTVDVDDTVPMSFSPIEPPWLASTAASTLGGVYDGSQGTGTLTFRVDREGTHGVDDLKVKVYKPDGSFLEDINISKNDPLNQQYTLSNGLVFSLGAGDLLKNTEFTVDVLEAAPTALNGLQPAWDGFFSNAQATIDGTYDGSNGTGILTFRVDREGTHGTDDLKIKVYDPGDTFIEDINISKNDPLNTQYTLSNGLMLTLGAGDLLDNDTFTVDVAASPTSSFSSHEPVWAGLGTSDAQVTLDGTYDGSNGIGTFNFVSDKTGTHGVDDLKIKVYQPDGSFLEDINISENDPINTQYTLSNGIELTLGAGDLLDTDRFTLTFTDTIGSAVDPDKPFNGTGNDNPNLQEGFSVTAGSFEVNGETINVNADDTINDVLQRITNSTAGVTASFDVATESVVLTQNTPGPAPAIVLANDSSGFLAAMKLNGATPEQGSDADIDTPMAQLPLFASVQSGSLSVNGVDIAIDVNADSLNAVLDRITASSAGVTASFDPVSQRVSFVADDPNSSLVLDDGATGFFSTLAVEYTLNVTAGSFDVNGETISVIASDTLSAVLERITNSNAGVTASFDEATQSVVLTQNTPGSAPDIVLANDSSGFLASVQLDGVAPVPGIDAEADTTLSQVQQFAAVQSGTLSVNGVDVSIDVDADTLNDVLERINASGAGVTASFDPAAQRVSIVSDDPDQQLVLDGGGTGFFSALAIQNGTYGNGAGDTGQSARRRRPGVSAQAAKQIADVVEKIAAGLNTLFANQQSGSDPGEFLTQLRNDIQQSVSKTFKSESSRLASKFGVRADLRDAKNGVFDFSLPAQRKLGMRLDFQNTAEEVFNFSSSARRDFVSSLRSQGGAIAVRDLFLDYGASEPEGLIQRLTTVLNQAESDLKTKIRTTGLFVDVLV